MGKKKESSLRKEKFKMEFFWRVKMLKMEILK